MSIYTKEVEANLQKAIAFFEERIAALPPREDCADFAIRKKVVGGTPELKERGPATILVLGDSVSQGCFGGAVGNDYHAVYHNQLRLLIAEKFPSIPTNVINLAIGGISSPFALETFEERVVHYNPDLVIVCFGLNDINGSVERYTSAIGGIFDKCKEHGFDCVFMTPNMLNTYRSPEAPERFFEYAQKTADTQTGGVMDTYMQAARDTAAAHGVPLCDGYALWKEMERAGIDITLLLANYINHPLREMHMLFALLLYHTIFGAPFTGAAAHTADAGMTDAAE